VYKVGDVAGFDVAVFVVVEYARNCFKTGEERKAFAARVSEVLEVKGGKLNKINEVEQFNDYLATT
jgi:hypothetical protein